MKTLWKIIQAMAVLSLFVNLPHAAEVGTAFTYQGRLDNGTNSAEGSYDFVFRLYDAPILGTQVGGDISLKSQPIVNGLFNATLDFGQGVFNGQARWMEIAVRKTPMLGFQLPYVTLTPRQAILPIPYAMYAQHIDAGGVASALPLNLTPTSIGTKSGDTFELYAGSMRTLRTDQEANWVGGFGKNSITDSVKGATISGGGGMTGGLIPYSHPNQIAANFASIGGGWGNQIKDGAAAATIGGGENNSIAPGSQHATLGGGFENAVGSDVVGGTIAGGRNNILGSEAWDATIGGGNTNVISANAGASTVAGGWRNRIGTNTTAATVGGGKDNVILGSANYATIGGGLFNNISVEAEAGTIAGGSANYVSGKYGFAAGYQARAEHSGSFVWSDASGRVAKSLESNQFMIQAANGVVLNADTRLRFGGSWGQKIELMGSSWWGIGTQPGIVYFRSGPTLSPGNGFAWYVSGQHSDSSYDPGAEGYWLMRLNFQENVPQLCKGGVLDTIFGTGDAFTGGQAWLDLNGSMHVAGAIQAAALCESSDRNLKEKIVPADTEALLNKVLSLPISEWSFVHQSARHIGPMAQDFSAAFKVGYDDKHITTVDADGVALAAIQGLNQKLEEKNAALEKEIAELKETVATLAAKINGGRP
ncbi:MAG TPA: tail fiber domain-containing protein [Candidatus Paceibacterota bacterium]|nr:tail fiber domain-containing protein [Verrucomicrobiota bacterium]HRY51860.1 tail fiber domain-containing protein [Candidatus Paceibacterota bacterium]